MFWMSGRIRWISLCRVHRRCRRRKPRHYAGSFQDHRGCRVAGRLSPDRVDGVLDRIDHVPAGDARSSAGKSRRSSRMLESRTSVCCLSYPPVACRVGSRAIRSGAV